jgi:hypothetical protein
MSELRALINDDIGGLNAVRAQGVDVDLEADTEGLGVLGSHNGVLDLARRSQSQGAIDLANHTGRQHAGVERARPDHYGVGVFEGA